MAIVREDGKITKGQLINVKNKIQNCNTCLSAINYCCHKRNSKLVTETLTFKRVQILLRDRFLHLHMNVLLTAIINKTILGGCKVQKGWLELGEKLQIQLRLATQSN